MTIYMDMSSALMQKKLDTYTLSNGKILNNDNGFSEAEIFMSTFKLTEIYSDNIQDMVCI